MKPERIVVVGALALAACQTSTSPPGAKSVALVETDVAQVADAIATGMEAEREGSVDGLVDAVLALERFGARFGDDTPDLSRRWRDLARARGADLPPPFRGRALGPAYSRGAIDPRGVFVTEQVFLAGQPAEVAVVPQAERQLRIVVTDQDNKILCERVAAAPRAMCRWLPLFTRRVTIRVQNPRAYAVNYYLVTN